MKKLALSLLLFVAILTNGIAQGDDQKFHFGLKASPSVTWFRVNGDGVKNEAIRIGFTYGLMTEFMLTKNYAFATGVDISYRGGKYSENIPLLGSYNVVQKLQFVDVPVNLKLKTNEIGYMKYYGLFGVSPGILVKATKSIESELALIQNTKNKGNQSEFSVFNLSLNVGLGIEYNLGGNTSFTAGIHYTNGLIDIWKAKNRQLRSDGIILNLGILF